MSPKEARSQEFHLVSHTGDRGSSSLAASASVQGQEATLEVQSGLRPVRLPQAEGESPQGMARSPQQCLECPTGTTLISTCQDGCPVLCILYCRVLTCANQGRSCCLLPFHLVLKMCRSPVLDTLGSHFPPEVTTPTPTMQKWNFSSNTTQPNYKWLTVSLSLSLSTVPEANKTQTFR